MTRTPAPPAAAAFTAAFIAISTAVLAAATAMPASAAEYRQVRPERSRIAFTSRQMGVPVDGRFRKFSAALHFDPARLSTASARIDIELASVDAGSKDADDEVVGKPWFNASAFPTASFVSSGVKALGGDRYEAVGTLSIKGRTQDVTLPFTFRPDGGDAVFDGSLTLRRLDFAIGEGVWADVGTVANEVRITFRIVAAGRK